MRSDTTPAGPRDLPKIWDNTKSRIIALVKNIGDQAGSTPLTTAPGASVRDVFAHLATTARRAADAPEEFARDTLTPPQPGESVSDVPLTDVLAEWDKAVSAVRGLVETDAVVAALLITDAVMCEHDLRTALNVPAARDDIAVKVALDEFSARFSDRAEQAALPPLRVTVEQWGTIVGNGRAGSCVVADRFEFVRAMSGRRSAAEIQQWNWGVEPTAYFSVISEIGLPAHEVHERDPRIPEHMKDREFVL